MKNNHDFVKLGLTVINHPKGILLSVSFSPWMVASKWVLVISILNMVWLYDIRLNSCGLSISIPLYLLCIVEVGALLQQKLVVAFNVYYWHLSFIYTHAHKNRKGQVNVKISPLNNVFLFYAFLVVPAFLFLCWPF